jgi:ABC-type sugar transport system ATPase subunit
MSFLKVENISKQIDGNSIAKNVSFTQHHLQKIAIAGETGSGKSTILKTIAGLSQPDSGNVFFLDKRIEGPWEKLIPGHPGIAYLSQQFELPKFLRVEQALAYANKTSPEEAAELFEICRIGHLLKRKTDQLSGGEQQRIALARLLVGLPKLLLLDEPFSNLDVIHKGILKSVIADVESRLQITCTLISHDPMDLLSWADEILIMKNGEIVQQATPEEVYQRPVTEYVGGLLGKYNLLTGAQAKQINPTLQVNDTQQVFLRPEQFIISNEININSTKGSVNQVRFMGNGYEADVQTDFSQLTVRTSNPLKRGETVTVKLPLQQIFTL